MCEKRKHKQMWMRMRVQGSYQLTHPIHVGLVDGQIVVGEALPKSVDWAGPKITKHDAHARLKEVSATKTGVSHVLPYSTTT